MMKIIEKKNGKEFDGIIFDLDGTLTMTENFHFEASKKIFDAYGIEYNRTQALHEYAGKRSEDIFQDVFSKNGRVLTEEEIKEFAKQKRTNYFEIIDKTPIEIVPGVDGFVEFLEENHITKGIATGNKIEAVKIILERTGLYPYFQVIVTNMEVKHSKPAPDIFLKTAEILHLEPQRCIVFEDALNGVKASKAAGMFCVGVSSGLPADELKNAGADEVIASYEQLSEIFIFKNN